MNQSNAIEFDDIIKFMVKSRGIGSGLRPSTRLYHDLGIDGDDAEELLLDFQKQFNVDLSSLDFDQHFGPEWSLWLLLPWVWKKFAGKRNKARQVMTIPITLNDLYEAARKKHWPDLSNRPPE